MKRSGTADLPLHGGRVPTWLAERMMTLGSAIVESVLYEYGRGALLSRLSDPFWFQALGSVMGMDWHSSGITTSVMGALKRGLNPRAHELGIYICGGRGRQSRHTPRELRDIAERISLDGDALVRTSRLTARVDNNAIADVIHGTPTRFDDPARFSFAHGGKDGHPFPVPLKVYDESLAVLRRALNAAKVGHTAKLEGLARLDTFTRKIESRHAPDADVDATIAYERSISPSLGGRTVFDDQSRGRAPRRPSPPPKGQLTLF